MQCAKSTDVVKTGEYHITAILHPHHCLQNILAAEISFDVTYDNREGKGNEGMITLSETEGECERFGPFVGAIVEASQPAQSEYRLNMQLLERATTKMKQHSRYVISCV